MKIEVETMVGSNFEEYSSVHVCNFEFTNNIIVAHYPLALAALTKLFPNGSHLTEVGDYEAENLK